MIFKRKKNAQNDTTAAPAASASATGTAKPLSAADKPQSAADTAAAISAAAAAFGKTIDNSKAAPADRSTAGPFDVTEVPAIRPYIDMGSIKVAPREGLKVRLDIDDNTKRIVAISLDYEGSTLQVQAFSAPKSTGLWNEAREQISQALSAQGALVSTREGVFGTEVVMQSPPGAEQEAAVRFFGVDGPRWMLRGVLVGKGALEPEQAAGIEAVFRELVVVRGEAPLPPSELLSLQMPANITEQPQG